MIGYLQGEVIFSDGHEVILLNNSGLGHQIFYRGVLAEGSRASLFISHIIKEAGEELYGFQTLRKKKLFEILVSVKGVGPKSAFSLQEALGTNQIYEAISTENKKALSKAPGIGPKAAAQIILDLGTKIHKIKMYADTPGQILNTNTVIMTNASDPIVADGSLFNTPATATAQTELENINQQQILDDVIMACNELGFKEEKTIPVAQRILNNNSITKAEQLVHLVLKEM